MFNVYMCKIQNHDNVYLWLINSYEFIIVKKEKELFQNPFSCDSIYLKRNGMEYILINKYILTWTRDHEA